MRVEDIERDQFPLLLWNNEHKSGLYIVYGVAAATGAVHSDAWSKDKRCWEERSNLIKKYTDWMLFDPSKDKLPEGCVLPPSLRHLSPKPKMRAWSGLDEIPMNMFYIRNNEWEKGARVTPGLSEKGVCYTDPTTGFVNKWDWEYLSLYFSWSADGVSWFPCGKEVA